MVEEGTTPMPGSDGQPRVVRKVVKKTVVRPAGQGAPTSTPPRPVAPRATAVSRLGRKAPKPPADQAGTTSSTPTVPGTSRPSAPRGPRTTVDVGARLGAARDRARVIAGGGAGVVRRGSLAARDRGADAFWAARDYRLPVLPPLRAGAITGLVAGLVVVLTGWLATLLFTQVRGTSAGGGVWGLLAVLVMCLVAFEVGSRLLTAFGVPHARATLGLSFAAVAIVVMLVFLETVDGPWAWVVVPGLAAVVTPLVHLLVDLGERDDAPVEPR